MPGQGTIPDNLKVDHLILLVGGNPLPNAVAGKLLLKPGGRITLVHSSGRDGTGTIADRLTDWFSDQGISNVVPVEVNESDARAIFDTVSRTLSTTYSRSGLNYTGGTKTMSVYAYDALKSWAADNNQQPIFSYLDARTLQMVFDNGRRLYTGLAPAPSIDIAALFSLQGWTLNERPNITFHNSVPAAAGADKGKQLEIKTGEAILALQKKHNLTEMYMNVYAATPDMQKRHSPEFDVITLRGYQLYFFSCGTTISRTNLKMRLFEAAMRARQIGGDEACAALVCLKTDPTLEAEARLALGIEGRIKVFHGIHQNDLQQHISNWIKQQSKEELA